MITISRLAAVTVLVAIVAALASALSFEYGTGSVFPLSYASGDDLADENAAARHAHGNTTVRYNNNGAFAPAHSPANSNEPAYTGGASRSHNREILVY